jgi:hypothetical protein
MAKGEAFLVVGHKNWGKSATLKALTDDCRYYRSWSVGDVEFFVRRMSNDDKPKDFLDLVTGLDPAITPNVIATLCPTFNDKKLLPLLLQILGTLKRKYELFFFVLQHQGMRPANTIPDDEIDKLQRYGTVKVFHPQGAAPKKIARAFEAYVKQFA